MLEAFLIWISASLILIYMFGCTAYVTFEVLMPAGIRKIKEWTAQGV
jgi:hypothetical protein